MEANESTSTVQFAAGSIIVTSATLSGAIRPSGRLITAAGLTVNAAISFAPVGHLVPAALEALEKGGALVLAGIHVTAIPALDYERHVFYERDIRSVTANTREDGRRVLEAIHAIYRASETGRRVSLPLR